MNFEFLLNKIQWLLNNLQIIVTFIYPFHNSLMIFKYPYNNMKLILIFTY